MVNIVNGTKLFNSKNISRFAKEKAKLLYAVLGEAIPNTESEYSTIGIALTPDDAVEMCESSMGDAIEVWVIQENRGLLSEKWEPKYFKEHFNEIVEYSSPGRDGADANDEFSSESDDSDLESENFGMGIEMPQEVVLGKALLEILECEQFLSKSVATASYMTGHPIDINGLLEGLHASIADILKAFSTSKGGFAPKFHKKEGVLVPYWTKTQIRQAKIKS